jgi:quinoprotein glucose dehydrogenase
VFLFDRVTGEPLFEIEEVPYPASELEGEAAWPTQPIPVKPPPFARQSQDLTVNDLSPYAPNREELESLFTSADRRQYRPPGLDPVLLLPGYDGAAEWGGAGADPDHGVLYVNSNEMAWFLQMLPSEQPGEAGPGEAVYKTYCVICHQANLGGLPASGYPSLVGLKDRMTQEEVAILLTRGKGMMPGFPQINDAQREALISYLFQLEGKAEPAEGVAESAPLVTVPFEHRGYHKFLDANGLPAISPPWGTLHAIDLNTGDFLWSSVLGDTPELRKQGFPPTGTENYGGPVITENGLLFIAATKDGYFRAFDRHTGELLWEYELPAAAFATPALYQVDGKQYLALACGGEKLGTPKGNKIIAFSLDP